MTSGAGNLHTPGCYDPSHEVASEGADGHMRESHPWGPRLLGRPLPRPFLAWAGLAVATGALLRLVYPTAVVLLGASHSSAALQLVVLSVGLAAASAYATHRATHAVRPAIYGVLGAAARNYPIDAREPSHTRFEAEIARATPSLEACVSQWVPAVLGNLLALPVIAYFAVLHFGLVVTLLLAAGLTTALAIGGAASWRTTAAARRAWRGYQDVARLVERGIRARGELRVHGLGAAYDRHLSERVESWSRHDRLANVQASVSAWSLPLLAVLLGLGALALLGQAPLHAAALMVTAPHRHAVVGGLFALAAFPVVIGLSRNLAHLVIFRPDVEALTGFVRAATVAGDTGDQSTDVDIGAITLEGVRHDFRSDKSAVSVGASFTWHPGESIALVGPSGAGKTTVIRLLVGLLEPDAGSITVASGVSSLRGRVGYLAQYPYFDPAETVADAIHFVVPDVPDDRASELLRRLLGTPTHGPWLERTMERLSAGQRRLVALARVLLGKQTLLVLDEPETSLDPESRERVADALRDAARSRRMLIATHDRTIAGVADRVLRFESHTVSEPPEAALARTSATA